MRKKATRYITRKELAERLGLSAETIRRMERAGRVRSIRIGPRAVRYSEDQVEALASGAMG